MTETTRRPWWDRWIAGFWFGVMAMGLLFPYLHPPEIRVINVGDKEGAAIADRVITLMEKQHVQP